MGHPHFLPDIVVYAYVLNDTRYLGPRDLRPLDVEDFIVTRLMRTREQPETAFLARMRLRSKLIDLAVGAGERWREKRRTVAFYRALYSEDNRAGVEMTLNHIEAMKRRVAPSHFLVVLLPLLIDLDNGYPFADVHAMLMTEVKDRGVEVLDLLPAFEGRRSRDLWAAEWDHHPNARGHEIIAREILGFLEDNAWLSERTHQTTLAPWDTPEGRDRWLNQQTATRR